MTNQHPITPPHDQVYWWWEEACKRPPSSFYEKLDYVAEQAARWGADMELEACCKWLRQFKPQGDVLSAQLRTHRRPKPPSLAEVALEEVGVFEGMGTCNIDIIRRALERLQELENGND